MEILHLLPNVGVAIVGGAVIGFERQWFHKQAGLRTNTLVCLGATLFVTLGHEVGVAADMARIIGQVVVGIGFLGAGVILHQGEKVQGLTTAATIWCSAAVGCLAGAGYLLESLLASFLIVLINFFFRKVDFWLQGREGEYPYARIGLKSKWGERGHKLFYFVSRPVLFPHPEEAGSTVIKRTTYHL